MPERRPAPWRMQELFRRRRIVRGAVEFAIDEHPHPDGQVDPLGLGAIRSLPLASEGQFRLHHDELLGAIEHITGAADRESPLLKFVAALTGE